VSLREWDGINPLTGGDWNNNIEQLIRGILHSLRYGSYVDSYTTWENPWLKLSGETTKYPCVQSCFSVEKAPSQGYPNKPARLYGMVIVKCDEDVNWFPFFFEPHKGNYYAFQGFHVEGGTHKAKCRNLAVDDTPWEANLDTLIGLQDWSVETELRIYYFKGEKVEFYVNGALAVTCTSTTDISNSPFEVCAIEPDGNTHHTYLKFPPGLNLIV